MRSRMSIFSPTLAKKLFTRFWPLLAAYTIILFLAVISPLSNAIPLAETAASDYYQSFFSQHLLRVVSGEYSVLSMIYAMFIAMAVFAYMYNSRTADAYHCLPIKRGGIFATGYLTGLGFILAPHLLIFVLGLFVGAGGAAPFFTALLIWLGAYSIQGMFFFSLAVLCAHATGSIVMMPILTIIMNFLVTVVVMISGIILEAFGYQGYAVWFTPLSPCAHLASRYFFIEAAAYSSGQYQPFSWGYFIGLLVASIACAALGLLLYHLRKTESAGDVIAPSKLRPLFKYCFATGCAMVLGIFIAATFFTGMTVDPASLFSGWQLTLSIFIGGAIGYYAAEAMLMRNLKISRRAWQWLFIFLGVLLAATSVFWFDLLGLGKVSSHIKYIAEMSFVFLL